MKVLANSPVRIAASVLGLVILLHFLATFTHDGYARATSIQRFATSTAVEKIVTPHQDPENSPVYTRVNATFVILCRNDQLWDTIRSVREIEDKFNHKYHYPYVFLNEVPFDEEFKYRLKTMASSTTEFGLIPREHWFQPDWIDEDKASKSRDKMQSENIIYGGSLSYRNMCRFNSGFFFRHPLMEKYKWYWRIEPDVHFHCNILIDPFRYMEEHNKVYAFTISMVEYEATIPTLWGHVKGRIPCRLFAFCVLDFIKLHPEFVEKKTLWASYQTMAPGIGTICAIVLWSNFEIANMEFWRGEAYMKFFEYLDSQGGFYYERWGDAPVHSIAAALFASRDQIHFFDEIGYEHAPYTHCPKEGDNWARGKCTCKPDNNFDFDGISCLNKFQNFMKQA
ncbi:hypothetical protein CVT25_013142 [Psilocybe cyanescens]|uniref:Glycosyltransferase family 15 protein n=1 Tax=Psilocybe cyanescens TaxID=93625 RepID=A0A409XK22_PSICY|nr:hypothetical protein CVT25_013142 [Psilocybe cyanescens]